MREARDDFLGNARQDFNSPPLACSLNQYGVPGIRLEDLCGTLVDLASDASNYVTGRDILADAGHALNVWLEPLCRTMPPLVSREEEVQSLTHDLDALGIPHDENGVTTE